MNTEPRMTIAEADAAICAAFDAGRITQDEARRAQDAIRQRVYYGQCMTPRDRASIVRNRFGIN